MSLKNTARKTSRGRGGKHPPMWIRVSNEHGFVEHNVIS